MKGPNPLVFQRKAEFWDPALPYEDAGGSLKDFVQTNGFEAERFSNPTCMDFGGHVAQNPYR